MPPKDPTRKMTFTVIRNRPRRRPQSRRKTPSGQRTVEVMNWCWEDNWFRWRSTCMKSRKFTGRWDRDTPLARLPGVRRFGRPDYGEAGQGPHRNGKGERIFGSDGASKSERRGNNDWTIHHQTGERIVVLKGSDVCRNEWIGIARWPRQTSSPNIRKLQLRSKNYYGIAQKA